MKEKPCDFQNLVDPRFPDLQKMAKDEELRQWLKEFNFISIGDPSAINDFFKFLSETETGYALPWSTIGDKFLVKKYELTLISGYTGSGKSEMANHILLNCIQQGAKGYLASLEFTVNELRNRILIQATGISNPTLEFAKHFLTSYHEKIFLQDTRGIASIDSILDGCVNLHKHFGVDIFVFDNLMMLNSAVDDYNKQFETARKISEFAKTYPVSVFLVAHSRKPSGNEKNFKMLDAPTIYDVHGASSVGNLVDNHISVAINRYKQAVIRKKEKGYFLSAEEDEALKRGDAILRRDKKRSQGELFKSELFFDKKFARLKDYESQILKPYVEFNQSGAHGCPLNEL
jgi:archaellum biogenesis ATPase FlaH